MQKRFYTNFYILAQVQDNISPKIYNKAFYNLLDLLPNKVKLPTKIKFAPYSFIVPIVLSSSSLESDKNGNIGIKHTPEKNPSSLHFFIVSNLSIGFDAPSSRIFANFSSKVKMEKEIIAPCFNFGFESFGKIAFLSIS